MPELTVSGAIIESFAKHREKSGCYTRIHVKSDVSASLQDLLGVNHADLPENVSSFPFVKDCALSAQTVHIEPNDKEFKKEHSLQLGCDLVSEFKLARVKDEEGNGGAFLQASFNIRTRQKDACAYLENLAENIGGATLKLRIKYSEQSLIDDGTAPEPATSREAGRKARKETGE